MPPQFWDTSAFVSLFYREPFSQRALAARAAAERYMAWSWLDLESWSAFTRRGSTPAQRRSRARLLAQFGLLSLDDSHHPRIRALVRKHRLRAADAAHLLCLKQARKLFPRLVFVCCDRDLVAAAGAERIRVWS